MSTGTEQRKEFADTRMRPHKTDRRFSGMATIPEARAWMLRKYEKAQAQADDESLPAETRQRAEREARSMATRLKADGVLTDD